MMCAFMTPVLKNDWELYQTKNSRTSAEAPQKGGMTHRSQSVNYRRKALEQSRSLSYAGQERAMSDMSFQRGVQRAYHQTTRNSRNPSRTYFSPQNTGACSPTKSSVEASPGRKKSHSSSSLSKFHIKVMDKLRSALHLKDSDSESKTSEDVDEKEVDAKSHS